MSGTSNGPKASRGSKRLYSDVYVSSPHVIGSLASADGDNEIGSRTDQEEHTVKDIVVTQPNGSAISNNDTNIGEEDPSSMDDGAKRDFILNHRLPNTHEAYKLVSSRWFDQIRAGNFEPVCLAKGAAGEKCSLEVYKKIVDWFGFNQREIALRVAHVDSDRAARIVYCNASQSVKAALNLGDANATNVNANILYSSFATSAHLVHTNRKLDQQQLVSELELSENETLLIESVAEHSQPKWPVGKVGLCNMGNSCFMNSSLQALLHIPELVTYFGSQKYKKDLNLLNPIGCQGQVADAFHDLMLQVYGERQQSVTPVNFRATIGRFNRSFANRMQQDSQEFTVFLLDGLHEDLNRVLVKPITTKPELKEDEEPTDEVVRKLAEESWKSHTLRNDSEIMSLFTGMYKSTLVCPISNKVSITFDPFFDLTLPLPKKTAWLKTIKFVAADSLRPLLKVDVALTPQSTIHQMQVQLCDLLRISDPASLTVCDVYNHKFFRILQSYEIVSAIDSSDDIHVYEVPPSKFQIPVYVRCKENDTGIPFFVFVDSVCTNEIKRQIIARIKQLNGESGDINLFLKVFEGTIEETTYGYGNKNFKLFGEESPKKVEQEPFESIDYSEPIGNTYEFSTSTEKLLTPIDSPKRSRSPVEISSPSSVNSKIGPDNHPLSSPPCFGETMSDVCEDGVSADNASGNVDMQEEQLDLQNIIIVADVDIELSSPDIEDVDYVHNPVAAEARAILDDKTDFTLEDCLRGFSQPEMLGDQDLWYCPRCKEFRKAQKQMEIWRVPNILMVHLKRFSGVHSMAHKIDDLVKFPIDSLNLKPFVSPIAQAQSPDSEFIYELFAVDNHFGGMGGGHYTAYVKNPFGDSEWLDFNDSYVRSIDPSEICTPAAYLLFYRKRSVATSTTVKEAYDVILQLRKKTELAQQILPRTPAVQSTFQSQQTKNDSVFTGEGKVLGTLGDSSEKPKLPWSP